MVKTKIGLLKWLLLAVVGLQGFVYQSKGIIAEPVPRLLLQKDGSKVKLVLRGDEFFHWYEDMKGYTVISHQGNYVYARLNSNEELVPTPFLAGKVDPAIHGLKKGILPSKRKLGENRRSFADPNFRALAEPVVPSGIVKNLVILCRFSDHTIDAHTRSQADFNYLFNERTASGDLAPSGSVKDYFTSASYGDLDFQSTVLAWVTLPQTEAYYGNGQNGMGRTYPKNAQGMIQDALKLVDPMVNFSDFDQNRDGYIDSITIIHSGYGGEYAGAGTNRIWSHKWNLAPLTGGAFTSADKNANGVNVKVYDYHTEPALFGTSGNTICRIGVIAHETGHFFGLPDLYDIDKSSSGIGSWCLMANSWGFLNDQLYPPYPSAWARIQLGWVFLIQEVSANGKYTVYPSAWFDTGVFRIRDGFPEGEYLLIENRQQLNFDMHIPGEGLAIWHIDENKSAWDNEQEGYPGQPASFEGEEPWPYNGKHYQVALLQADGLYELEKFRGESGDAGDLYSQDGLNQITPDTVPNTDAYQDGKVYATGHRITNVATDYCDFWWCSISFDFQKGTPIRIISPKNGEVVEAGSNLPIVAESVMNDGRTQVVDFFLNGNFFHEDWAGPYEATFHSIPSGELTLMARAWNHGWQLTDSKPVKIKATVFPSVSITSPSAGAVINSQTVVINAEASDPDGTIAKVEFYSGSDHLGSDNSAPYTLSWRDVTSGNYNLIAKAYDNVNAARASVPVNITVTAPSRTVLFVVGSTSLNTSDAALKNLLEANDWGVVVMSASSVTSSDATGKNLVLISESVSSSNVNTKFKTTTVPVMSMESGVFDDMGLTGTATTEFAAATGQTKVKIVSSGHELAGGVGGTPIVYTAAGDMSWGKPASTAARIATLEGATDRWTIFGYPKGVAMVGLNAPARRAGFFIGSVNGEGSKLTADGQKLFLAASDWTADTSVNAYPTVSISSPANGATFTTGSSIPISAVAEDTNGTVTKVQFFNGTTSISSDTTSPYAVTWNSVAAGTHQLTAKATDDAGQIATSSAVKVIARSGTGTIVTLNAVADSYVRDGSYAGSNYGASTLMETKNGTSGYNRRAFLRFDITSVPSTISTAKLRMYGKYSGTSGSAATQCYSVATDSWTESGVTWNNQPVAGTLLSTVTVTTTSQYWEWDVTTFVKSEKAAGQTLASFSLRNDAAFTSQNILNSDEASSNRPQLVISP